MTLVPHPRPELTRSDPSEKQEKSSLVELKNGKVYFRQKPLSLEKQSETLQGEFLSLYIALIPLPIYILRNRQIP